MPENVTVKKSTIRGKGVFALKDFEKDELILHMDGEVVETDNPSRFPREMQDHLFPFDKKGGKISYVIQEDPGKYINHSCEPNAGIRNNRDIVAIRKIRKGEEIFFDYSMNSIDARIDPWKMKCECKSKNCRKTISDFDSLNEETKRKYKDYVLDCIKRKYLKGLKRKSR